MRLIRLTPGIGVGFKSVATLVAVLMFCAVFTLQGYAQVDRGGIVGSVEDSSGARIAGARVTVTNLSTNHAGTVTSDAQGDFSANSLQIGTYSVKVEKKGFAAAVEQSVTVSVGQIANIK